MMQRFRARSAAGLVGLGLLCAGLAAAADPPTAAEPAASAASSPAGSVHQHRGSMHHGQAAGHGAAGMGMGMGKDLMTPQERTEHRRTLRGMHKHAECTAYMDKHRALMAERATAKGMTLPAMERPDACARHKG